MCARAWVRAGQPSLSTGRTCIIDQHAVAVACALDVQLEHHCVLFAGGLFCHLEVKEPWVDAQRDKAQAVGQDLILDRQAYGHIGW